MTKQELFANILRKQSFLCVGLDTDVNKIPEHLHAENDPVYAFNKAIIDATAPYCVAFKPNTAFYESEGLQGIAALEKTVEYIRTKYPDQFIILDAKRGDIGNTSERYAKAAFEAIKASAITVAPYMGEDSVKPFLNYANKWVILLALTSNKGANDFQMLTSEQGEYLFENVLKTSAEWGTDDQLMYVVGATQASMLTKIREIVPTHFLLVPGVGAQGGSLQEVAKYGMNKECGLLVNASRSIIYASGGDDFAQEARREAKKLQEQMQQLLSSLA